MKKYLILWSLYCLTANLAMAQCPDLPYSFAPDHWMNKVRICKYIAPNNGGVKYAISETAVVGQTVTFEATGLPIYLPGISFPNASSVVISGQTVTVTYSTFGKQIIRIITPNPADYILNIEIKAPIKPYKSPDAIWSIKTLNNFDPLTTDAKASYFSNTVNAQGVMNSTKGEAQAYIRFGKNHDGKIVRPIIYVDGIDFNSNTDIVHDASLGGAETSESNIIRYGSTGWDVFAMGIEPSESISGETEAFRKYPEHFDKMYEEGYDIIFLDFKEGATYMQKNAEVLIELLNQINGTSTVSGQYPNRKKVAASDGTLYENIVVGASMGGQVSKYALAKMEYEERTNNGPSHCAKLYVSFDSQHKGAVVPLGIQGAAWYAAQTCTNGSLWSKLNQPAARQLLIEHLSNLVAKKEVDIRYIPTSDFGGFINTNDLGIVALEADEGKLRAKFLQDLQQFSPNGLGYPKATNNIAIADGNCTGLNAMTFGMGVPLLSTRIKVPTVAGGFFIPVHFRVNSSDGVQAGSSPCNTDFGCGSVGLTVVNTQPAYFGGMLPNGSGCLDKLPNKFKVGFVLKSIFAPIKPSYDNAPGSYRRDLNTLHDILLNTANEEGGSLIDETANWSQRTCFSPTLSCLDVIGKDAKNASDLIMNIGLKGNTPFDSYHAPTIGTLQHVEIDDAIINYINQQLLIYREDLKIAKKLDNQTYNYGYLKKRIPSLNINSGGYLRVNNYNAPQKLDSKLTKTKVVKNTLLS